MKVPIDLFVKLCQEREDQFLIDTLAKNGIHPPFTAEMFELLGIVINQYPDGIQLIQNGKPISEIYKRPTFETLL